MANVYCEYCGEKSSSVSMLTMKRCFRHPNGAYKGSHKPYEGREKSQYECKYCGKKSSSISMLTQSLCFRHPDGANKGRHAPML